MKTILYLAGFALALGQLTGSQVASAAEDHSGTKSCTTPGDTCPVVYGSNSGNFTETHTQTLFRGPNTCDNAHMGGEIHKGLAKACLGDNGTKISEGSTITVAPPVPGPIAGAVVTCHTAGACAVIYKSYYGTFTETRTANLAAGDHVACTSDVMGGDPHPFRIKGCQVTSGGATGVSSGMIPEGSFFKVVPQPAPTITYGVPVVTTTTATLKVTLSGSIGVTSANFVVDTPTPITVNACTGTCLTTISALISGSLACNTTYRYRVVLGGFNISGDSSTFKTAACPPPITVTNGDVSFVTKKSAKLSATLNNTVGVTAAKFLVNKNNLAVTIANAENTIAASMVGSSLAAALDSLPCGTKFAYRVYLTGVEKLGDIGTFQTLNCSP